MSTIILRRFVNHPLSISKQKGKIGFSYWSPFSTKYDDRANTGGTRTIANNNFLNNDPLSRRRICITKLKDNISYSCLKARGYQAHQQIRKNHTNHDVSRIHETDNRLIIVGSGVAGCSAALIAAVKYQIPVSLVCAGSQLVDCNSYWAQGGIIYRNYDPKANDSAESLVSDILRAGAGLCQEDAVWKVANEGPERVRELLLDERKNASFANVPFDRDEEGELLCCLGKFSLNLFTCGNTDNNL